MSEETCEPVSVSKRIDAPVEALFAILADPTKHPAIDGSGMLVESLSCSNLSRVGDVFVLKMHNDELGDYQMANHVVSFEANRRLVWEPVLAAASREEDRADIGNSAHHRWGFELEPDGPAATVVTETYDCSRSPEWLRRAVRGGQRWVESMTITLDKLAAEASATNV